ncbi:ubiquitin-specific protease 8 isoform X2 [Carex rostrata]
MATAAAASAASDAVSTSDHSPSFDDRVYLVPYRWWRVAQESVTEDVVQGVPYAATSASSYYGIRIINNLLGSDLVFHLRRSYDETSQHENGPEEPSSSRTYALIRYDLWSRALKWHDSSSLMPKSAKRNTADEEGSSVDVYPLMLRVSVMQEINMTIKISKKDNTNENYKRANKIFATDSEPVHIWDFSGQTNLILMNEWNRLPSDYHQNDQEILLEVQVYTMPGIEEYQSKTSSFPRGIFSRCEWDSISDVDLNSLGSGLIGLENLGNTCFMNSAVQCLAHTQRLVEYFHGDFTKDINKNNPLGMKGEIALAFGDLLRRLWRQDKRAVAPHRFKSKLAHFAPQFSGFNQHDSQELLAFLLDGLHEDLNGVKSKPYLEAKDSDGRPDAEVADEYWGNHLARNDSIIVDTCQGQYKSTLVCPECNKVSTTFDPFMYLSLPLPCSGKRTMTVTVFSTDGITGPLPCTITVPKSGTFGDFFQALSAACSLRDDETLLVAEVFRSGILRFLDEPSDLISLVRDGDQLAAYRVPRGQESSAVVVFMHQKVEGFGVPLVAKLPDKIDGPELRRMYMKLLNPFLRKKSCFSTSSISDDSQDDSNSTNSSTSIDSSDISDSSDECMNIEDNLTFFLANEKGHISQTEQSKSKINMDQPSEALLETHLPKNRLHVVVQWQVMGLAQYDMELLSCLPEVYKELPVHRRLKDQESVTLYQCLDKFINEEPLGPDDMWYCPSCKEHRQASKKLDLWRLPEILVIHLKRFSYNRYTKNKLETYVDFPICDLDLSKYITHRVDDSASTHYRLYAISNHYGHMGGGHYTAYVFHDREKRWYDFDDRCVSVVQEDNIKTAAAYVLFYRRVDPTD